MPNKVEVPTGHATELSDIELGDVQGGSTREPPPNKNKITSDTGKEKDPVREVGRSSVGS